MKPFYNDSRDLNEIIKQITEIVEKLKEKIAEFQKNLIDTVEKLKQSIKDAISKIDIPGMIQKIEETLENILKENGVDITQAKACLDAAKTESEAIVKNTQDDLTKCVEKADDVLRTLNDKRLELEDQAKLIISHAKDMVVKCVKDHPIPTEAFKCIVQQFDGFKAEIDEFVQHLTDFAALAKELVITTAADIDACVGGVATSAESQVSTLVDNFRKCVAELGGGMEILNSKVTIQEIIEQIQKIIKQIIDDIKNIINEIPALIKDLEEKIKQFLQDFDINKIIEEIRKKLEEILTNAGIDPSAVPECIKAAEEETKKVAQETYEATKTCVMKVDDVLRELKDRVLEFEEKAKKLIVDIEAQVKVCVTQKPIPEILPCLQGLVPPATEEFNKLAAELKEFVSQAKDAVQKAGTEFVSCMSNVNSTLVAKEKAVLDTFKECIKPKLHYP